MTRNDPFVIFSDSDALIGDIEFVFKDQLDFVSSKSLSWVKEYLHHHDVKLLIADMDMKSAAQAEVLNGLRELDAEETHVLFLVSERKMLELSEVFEELHRVDISTDWLVKPFSRNALISTVGHLCG